MWIHWLTYWLGMAAVGFGANIIEGFLWIYVASLHKFLLKCDLVYNLFLCIFFLGTSNQPFECQVALTHGPENVKPQVKQTDESGNFCFEVSLYPAPLISIFRGLNFLRGIKNISYILNWGVFSGSTWWIPLICFCSHTWECSRTSVFSTLCWCCCW